MIKILERFLPPVRLSSLCIIAGLIASAAGCDRSDDGSIRVYGENPRYWEFHGKPVLLLGGSDEDNLFNNPQLMRSNLKTLAEIGGNYIRGTLSCRDEGNVWPYSVRNSVYNLDEFNPEFWNRLETCIREAEKRSIIVQIEVWATFDYYRENWPKNPFNPANNANYTTADTRLVTEWDYHPAQNVQAFFKSLPALNNDLILLKYQEAFVRKVLDVTLPYSNVLYCLDNETKAPPEWALYWGEFIKNEGKHRGKHINLTEMWDQWDITHADHSTTYMHPEFFSYTDISQNNWQEGQTHYDRLLWYRRNLAEQPGGIRPMNNVKVYARLSGGRPNDYAVGVDRWWQNIFAGCAATRFHRPPSGSGLDETAQTMIRAARVFTSAFDIFSCEPHPELLYERDDNETYCLAEPGKVYAVYFPKGGKIEIEVWKPDKDYRIRWFDTACASFIDKSEQVHYTKTTVIWSRGKEPRERRYIQLQCPTNDRLWLVLLKNR